MQYRRLGNSDLNVSLIGLGTMTWGEQNTETEAHEQLNYAVSQGVNLIDAAEMYPVPPRPTTQGLTETYIGSWLKNRGHHDDLVIASKVTGREPSMDWIRGGPRLDAASVRSACEESLSRLGIDCIDLYQVHWPDRQTNFFGKHDYQAAEKDDSYSIAETLGALRDLQAEGKIRWIGISNETPWGVTEYLKQAQDEQDRIVSIQNPYSLLNRLFEVGIAEFSHRESVPLLAYSPLAMGVLSGKYLNGQKPEGARLSLYRRFTRYNNARCDAATAQYVEIAQDAGLDPAQMALAFVNSRPFVGSNLIGATSMEQLKSNIASINVDLSADTLKALHAVHLSEPNPAP